MKKPKQAGLRSLLFVIVLCSPLAMQSRTATSTDFRQFGVVSIDGKAKAVGELKAGTKGTATITQTTDVRPVHVTSIKMGAVLSQTERSNTIKEGNRKVHRFSQDAAAATAAATPAADQPAATSASTTADAAAAPTPASDEGAKKPWLWLLVLIVLAAVVRLIVRSRPKKIPIRRR